MHRLRQRQDVDANDMSKDHVINAMTPIEKLEELCGWEMGDERWANVVMDWMLELGFTIQSSHH
jgi:hypothetical protein